MWRDARLRQGNEMVVIAVSIISLLAIISAFGVVFSRQAVNSALCLTFNLLMVALLYLCMHVQFLGVAQVVIYAGAIMVVFLFAVTVLAPTDMGPLHYKQATRIFGLLSGVVIGGALLATVLVAPVTTTSVSQPPSRLAEFAVQLFGRYVLPFEASVFVLLVALVGAVTLGHRRLKAGDEEDPRP